MSNPESETGLRGGPLPEESGVDQDPAVLESVLREMLDAPSGERAAPRFPGYSILSEVAQGGFGVVYRARDEKLGREVALKVLLPRRELDAAARERFLREARALASLRHPNVLSIHCVLEHEGQIALVTEFIEGEPLSDLLRERGPLAAAEAAQVGVELCRALAAVHAAGLVHRDVKTPNILRERGGRIVLTDFGLGVFLAEGRDPETCGFLAGSPLFMSPEQVRGEAVDARTDLYAAGVVLYNLATGKFPLTARDLPELFQKIRSGDFLPLRDLRPDLPGGFVEIVGKALAPRPEDRFRSAGAMEEALLEFLGEARRTRRRVLAWRVALGLAVLPLAGLAWFVFPPLRPEGTLLVEARFFLGTPGDAQPLRGGEKLELGSRVYLEFRANQAAHVYVLDESSEGERFVLFPLAGGQLANPLPGGVLHRLPGVVGVEELFWRLDTPSREEWLLVIASRERLPGLEDLIRETPRAAAGSAPAYPRLGGEETRGLLRGFGELAPAGAVETPAGTGLLARVMEDVEAEGRVRGDIRGLWMRKLTLRGGSR
jgi:tRNA A-37 threonylcarbamoyl transferase component Bud32